MEARRRPRAEGLERHAGQLKPQEAAAPDADADADADAPAPTRGPKPRNAGLKFAGIEAGGGGGWLGRRERVADAGAALGAGGDGGSPRASREQRVTVILELVCFFTVFC